MKDLADVANFVVRAVGADPVRVRAIGTTCNTPVGVGGVLNNEKNYPVEPDHLYAGLCLERKKGI